jgi:scyllo-inositol 2-dehydrogenase (NADP+)
MSTIIHTGIIGFGLSGRVFHAPFIDVLEGF